MSRAEVKEPEQYDGDNHGDTYTCAYNTSHFFTAEIARKALTLAASSPASMEKEPLITHFIDRADCACDNMEGADAKDMAVYETRMICAIETLELLGVKYDPISGKREVKNGNK